MLDFFKEIFTSTRSTVAERVKNPVVGALFFSWIAFNWDNILVMLFSAATVEDKIVMIKDNSTIFTTIYWPMASAVFILIALPLISAAVIWGQNKPTMFSMGKYAIRNDAILDRKIETEKKRARADIAYDREKTGEEEKIQKMREDIEISKEKTGEITKEKDELIAEKNALIHEKKELIQIKEKITNEYDVLLANYNDIRNENSSLRNEIKNKSSELDGAMNYIDKLAPKTSSLAVEPLRHLNGLRGLKP
ncbi:hypothetical protein CH54_1414 [Yersinia rochesterensis]|uniref:Uncharacterized protein n=1 Tax=Yersinia rochesterensis TaxID=1604335 RepID=A0ABM5SR12_9GAMM|nr:hypothetical protein [Yersinia rochesterensis]AIN19265.1 hypothetical protein DJ57_2261 [Yersinia rochesterensis]AJI88324.1 hypothetical protein AW19_250 [Yersinia frederiksenii Y225]AJJ36898.1 hypothetical protein CH54_1414 [Yersinia rochesterensis]